MQDGLGQHDLGHGLPVRQAQAAGGLHLALVHALDTGADNFRHVCTAVQRQADGAIACRAVSVSCVLMPSMVFRCMMLLSSIGTAKNT